MEKTKIIGISFISVLAILMTVSLCYGATATYATLHTTDATGNDKVQFNLGETVYIRWTADGTVNIEVKYQDGTTDGQWLNQTSTGVIAYVPKKGAGYYSVYCTGARVMLIAYGTYMVIPDIPLGVLMATVACFAGFGMKSIRAKKN